MQYEVVNCTSTVREPIAYFNTRREAEHFAKKYEYESNWECICLINEYKGDKKLTPKHWCLYRFVKFHTLGTKENTVSQWEIYNHLLKRGYDVTWKESQNQHNDHCRWLYDLIEEINFSTEVDHIIIHDKDYNYRLGSKQEVLALWDSFYTKMNIAKMRHVKLLQKIKQDGQGKIIDNAGKEMDDESLAKFYHETFNNSEESI